MITNWGVFLGRHLGSLQAHMLIPFSVPPCTQLRDCLVHFCDIQTSQNNKLYDLFLGLQTTFPILPWAIVWAPGLETRCLGDYRLSFCLIGRILLEITITRGRWECLSLKTAYFCSGNDAVSFLCH